MERPTSGSGVVMTPTKNRFDVIDTENKLQSAFQNLQRYESDQKLALFTIPEDQEHCFSDRVGTRSKSNMGVPENRSETNSDGEDENESPHIQKRSALQKHHKRYSKEPKVKSQVVTNVGSY